MISWFNAFKNKECNVILSAGGLRSMAQVGALKALEEEGWKIKNICGISAGSIIASFYASGCPLDLMENLAKHTDFGKFKKANYKRLHEGLFVFNGLGSWVADNCLKYGDSERRCTLYIGACSLSTARRKLFKDPWEKNILSTAIEATCTIPVVFKPVEYEGEKLADGALWSSAPVHFFSDKKSEAFNKLPTFVVNVQDSHLHVFSSFNNPIKLLYRVFEVFQINRLVGLKKRISDKGYSKVYMIEPPIEGVSSFNFRPSVNLKSLMIESGYLSTKKVLDQVAKGEYFG